MRRPSSSVRPSSFGAAIHPTIFDERGRYLGDSEPSSHFVAEVAPGDYLVEGHIDPQVLATVTAWCARLDVLATDMRVEQRSLEDVFLDLTGRKLRP